MSDRRLEHTPEPPAAGRSAASAGERPAGTASASRGTPHEGAIRIAAIDIGSNSVRQIVADVSPDGQIRVVDEMKAAPRLGAGLEASGALDPAAIRRAVEALGRMATLARHLGAERVQAVATSAVRDASNREAFLAQVREATGLEVRVLSGEEEARLGHLSALAHFDLAEGRTVVMDIGGGSLELALSAGGMIERLISLPLGAIRLTEQFLTNSTSLRDVRALRKHVRAELGASLPRRDWRGARIIGSGGTFTNLAAVHLARRGMSIARGVHATRLPRVDVEHVLDWLAAMTPAERSSVPGLNPARADIIVAGIAIAAEVMSRLDVQELTVSAYGIREGILLDAAAVAPVIGQHGPTRDRSVRAFADRCHVEWPHALQVQRLALQLFDALGEHIGCSPAERQTLADAALLHDVGYHISYDKHHKHSFHLIVHADLLGMSPEEQLVVANVARYHRGAEPKRRQEHFGTLSPALRERVVRLAALLRVADGFDRGHAGVVERVEVDWTDAAVRLRAVPVSAAATMRLELWGAYRKRGLLEKVAGRSVAIVAPDGSLVEDDG